jgi:hypothetical protein
METMRPLSILVIVSLLTGCGRPTAEKPCMSLEAKRLECRAEELAKNNYQTDHSEQYIKDYCERVYRVNDCY